MLKKLISKLFKGRHERDRKLIAEFKVRFPDRCMVCSFDRYAVSHGFQVAPLEQHACIEK